MDSSDFPLTQVASSLRPYIKTRREALRVRRTLTVYLGSALADSGDKGKLPYTLAAPDTSLSVKRIPTAISGLRKEYLKALQANERARKEYQSLSDLRSASDELGAHPISKKVDEDDEDDEFFQTYLALLRLRRRYEKLRIFQDYLQLLCRKAPANPQFLDVNEMLKELPTPPKLPTEAIQTTEANALDSSVSGIDTLTRRLEMSVLGAKHSLENERRLLVEWRDKIDGNPEEATAGNRKLHALGRVRNELIRWIESELSKTGNSLEGEVEQATGERIVDTDSAISQSVEGILGQYRGYVEARKSLLATLSIATLSLPTQERDSTTAHAVDEAGQVVTTDQTAPAYLFLPLFSHYLLPLSTFQKSIVQQKSCLTVGLAKQQRSIIQTIERLSEESHLLPAYPLLASQARFRNAAAALASRAVDNRPVSLERDIMESGGDDCIKKARAWAFAADAARTVTEDAVREKCEIGEMRIRSAQDTLAKLLRLLGQTVVSDGADEEGPVEDDGADIWTTMAAPVSKKRTDRNLEKARYRKMKDSDEGSGLWRGLDGELGIIGV
jgi:hypothetical protein